jgi:SAM-dependent methyltransferase
VHEPDRDKPSLENFLESEDIGLEILHPGGLAVTEEMAAACHIGPGSRVLDVSSGTGESACFLAEKFACSVLGVDLSEQMVAKARAKAAKRNLTIEFQSGDAHKLPFPDDQFDAVISECTLCLLNKKQAVAEMVRVAKPGGYVGMHDIAWRDDAPEQTRRRLGELEDEYPETLDGWKRLFEQAGLRDVVVLDRTPLLAGWQKEIGRELGLTGRLRLLVKLLRKWGWSGYRAVRASELIFRSPYMKYALVTGRK